MAVVFMKPDILELKRRRLHELERQKALHGASTPPEIAIEIEDIQREIGEIAAASVPPTDAERYHELYGLIRDLRWDVRVQYALLVVILIVVLVVK